MIDITKLIQEWRDGALFEESNERLQELVKDCCATDKTGTLTLTFKIEPAASKQGGHIVTITPKIESKNPRFDTGVGIFHVVTDEHLNPVGLEREDPRQTKLFNDALRTQ